MPCPIWAWGSGSSFPMEPVMTGGECFLVKMSEFTRNCSARMHISGSWWLSFRWQHSEWPFLCHQWPLTTGGLSRTMRPQSVSVSQGLLFMSSCQQHTSDSNVTVAGHSSLRTLVPQHTAPSPSLRKPTIRRHKSLSHESILTCTWQVRPQDHSYTDCASVGRQKDVTGKPNPPVVTAMGFLHKEMPHLCP